MPASNDVIDDNSTYQCFLYPNELGSTPAYIFAASPEDAAEAFHENYNADGYTSEITVKNSKNS